VAYVVFKENVALALTTPNLADSQAGKDLLEESAGKNEPSLPTKFALTDVYPNPFDRSVTIRYSMAEAGDVHLRIYNTLGQIVTVLVDGIASEGVHTIAWDGTDGIGNLTSSGVYLIQFDAGGSIKTHSVVHLR